MSDRKNSDISQSFWNPLVVRHLLGMYIAPIIANAIECFGCMVEMANH